MSLVVLMWGYNYTALKVVYQHFSPPAVALIRLLATLVFFWTVCLVFRFDTSYPPGQRLKFWLQGFLAFGCYMVCFLWGIEQTNPTEAAILLSTSPLWVQILNAIFKIERMEMSTIAGAVLAFSGAAVVVGAGGKTGTSTPLGIFLVTLGALIWAVSVLVMRPLLGQRAQVANFAMALPGALIILVPYGFSATLQQDYTGIPLWTWMNLAHVVFLSGGAAMPLFYKGIEQIGPARSTLYQFLLPPVAALMQWAVLGVPVLPLQWAGIAVVTAGIALGSAQSRKSAKLST